MKKQDMRKWSKEKVQKQVLSRENDPQPMNGGKEVIMDAKLWIVFKQRGNDIE